MKKTLIIFSSVLALTCLTIWACKKNNNNTPANTRYNISTTMNASKEVPANTSSATGTTTGTYDASTNTLTYTVNWTGLTGTATMAHFHVGSVGTNGPVVIPFTISGTTATGTTTLTDGQETDLLTGNWYSNVHTSANPGGEIRGQIVATQ